jgi:hypothetical protein
MAGFSIQSPATRFQILNVPRGTAPAWRYLVRVNGDSLLSEWRSRVGTFHVERLPAIFSRWLHAFANSNVLCLSGVLAGRHTPKNECLTTFLMHTQHNCRSASRRVSNAGSPYLSGRCADTFTSFARLRAGIGVESAEQELVLAIPSLSRAGPDLGRPARSIG